MQEDSSSSHLDQQQQELELCSACSLPPRRKTNGEPIPLRRCTRCQSTQYHDAVCQRSHYPTHKIACRDIGHGRKKSSANSPTKQAVNLAYRIEDRPSKGKCMYSNSAITANESIGNSKLASVAAPVLFESQRSSRCAICFAAKVDHVLCNDKRYIVHACRACIHTHHAESLGREIDAVKAATQIPRVLATAILVYRICVQILSTTLAWESIGCMISHSLVEGDPNAAVHQRAIVMTVSTLLGTTGQSMDTSRISSILSRIKVNAFTITDSHGESLGIGLYSRAHYINHSCCPNTRQSFSVGIPGRVPDLRLVTNTAIPIGEEITISYMDTGGLSKKERRAQLLQSYHFLCECPACQAESDK